jgi:hypothetical protein
VTGTAQALVKSLTCPSCGSAIEQRMGGWTQSIACGNCGSVLSNDASLSVLQEAERHERLTPRIPLGSRGRLRCVLWEVTGFQRRQIVVDGTAYHWDEYLLFNPWHGFSYLSEYNGHWNEITTVRELPSVSMKGSRPVARWDGESFQHFQAADAETVYVIGEFPWVIHRGDRVQTNDYIAPPRLLSSESTEGERTWSVGVYRTGEEIAAAFPDARVGRAIGVFANQPSPVKGLGGRMWRTWAVLVAALIGIMILDRSTAAFEDLFTGRYTYDKTAVSNGTASAENGGAFVTPVFTARGRTSPMEISIDSDVSQDWMYLNIALINVETGTAREFGREVSYYSGRDSDGSWSEGSTQDRVRIGSVEAGQYYLRVEPEGGDIGRIGGAPIHYTVRVRHGVPAGGFYVIAFLTLLVPPIIGGIRSASFEGQRWNESDYAPVTSSDDDDE